MTQLTLFATPPKPEPRFPWLSAFPDYMPKMGGLAQMHAVILPGQGYCYGDTVRILSIDGQRVRCVFESQGDPDFWKNGKEYNCSISDLWPNIYARDGKNN
jgi:hypothetical protein